MTDQQQGRTQRDRRWWASRTVDVVGLAVIGGAASGPLSQYIGIEGYGVAFPLVLLVGYWWLNVARPVFTDQNTAQEDSA